MNKKLIDWWIGGASYSSGYQAILDRATTLGYTLPSTAQRTKQDTLYKALRDYGILALTDILYVMANDVAGNFWKINWITPASYECTEPAGAVTKSANGIAGNGTSTYASTNFTPSTHAVNMTAANCGQGLYLHTVPTTGTYLCGTRHSVGTYYTFQQYSNSSAFQYRAIDNAGGSNYTGGSPSGSFMYNKNNGSGQYGVFKNGVSVQTGTSVSTLGLPTQPIYIGAASGNSGGFSNAVIGFYSLGAQLTGLEDDLYNAWLVYIS